MPIADVLDSAIHYLDQGSGDPIVFLHGNPTSSYLWRNILPKMEASGRCLAPDLIGMGESGKPRWSYRFADHARYLDAWFDELGLEAVTVVGHDWGGALAFDWAARHPTRTKAVAFMETIVRPMSWSEMPGPAQDLFKSLRADGVGESMVLDQNMFIEQALPYGVMTGLSEGDLVVYRAPYPTRDTRLPLLQWPRELPFDGEPADVVRRIQAYDAWLADSHEVPKLLLAFDPAPGMLMGTEVVAWCAAHIAALQIVHCGPAGHHAPEDQPAAIAQALVHWIRSNESRAGSATPSAHTEV